jgi:HEAT repeat protein
MDLEEVWSGDRSKIAVIAKAIKELPDAKRQHYLDKLIPKLKDDNADKRIRTAEVLGLIGDFRAAQPLADALKDKYGPARFAAEEALLKIGVDAEEPVIDALKDEKSYVRGAAAKVLGIIGDEIAIPPLKELFEDNNPFVRNLANDAIKNILASQMTKKISKNTRQEVAKTFSVIIEEELGEKK